MIRCPVCFDKDNVCVYATMLVSVCNGADGPVLGEAEVSTAEWNNNSAAVCASCNYSGDMSEFDHDGGDEDEDYEAEDEDGEPAE